MPSFSWDSCFSKSALVIPTFFNSATSSPFLCISKRMSHPPTNSPFMKTWGMVGQFEKSLIPKHSYKNYILFYRYVYLFILIVLGLILYYSLYNFLSVVFIVSKNFCIGLGFRHTCQVQFISMKCAIDFPKNINLV